MRDSFKRLGSLGSFRRSSSSYLDQGESTRSMTPTFMSIPTLIASIEYRDHLFLAPAPTPPRSMQIGPTERSTGSERGERGESGSGERLPEHYRHLFTLIVCFLGNLGDSEDDVYMQTPTPNEDDGLLQTKLREFDATLNKVRYVCYNNMDISMSNLG